MATKLRETIKLSGGTGVTITNGSTTWDGSENLVNTLDIGNNVTITGNVQFNSITASSWKLGDDISIYDNGQILGNVTNTGTLSISSTLTIPGNVTITGNVTSEEFIAELTSSSTIFKSGSTQFGDDLDDTHYITGSLYETGSFEINGYSVKETSNDTSLTDNSATALITENAAKAYADSNVGSSTVEPYLRKNYNRSASSISNNTASFHSAYSASAPAGITSTSESDFLFFNNGQVMEHDALSIEQSGSTFYLKIDPSGIGYNLASDDEIKAWGKFNA